MIDIKTKEEIEVMREGGKILASVMHEIIKSIKPGMTEVEIDALAESLIKEHGAEPGFNKVKGYKHATCISTNEVVVHGIPTNRKLSEGDIVGVDCGVYYKGFFTDMAETLRVSTVNNQQSTSNMDEIDKFLDTGKRALEGAIKVAVIGNRIGHISKTIQDIIEGSGYSVVRSLIGHGVGKKLHEEPEVPGFLDEEITKTPEIKPGMTFAVEIIYNMGGFEVSFHNNDGWTISTSDGSISSLFERTVAITDDGTIVLTV